LDWDHRVSRLHAELEQIDGQWLIVDDGLSRNGTFVNGQPVTGRRRLQDGDLVEVGGCGLVFRDPRHQHWLTTVAGRASSPPPLTAAQRRILVALCRPLRTGDRFARPATNQQVADELHLSVAAVKTHVRTLFQRFSIADLPHNEKRVALVRAALASGAVTPGELAEGR
jgi:hypothetical protein